MNIKKDVEVQIRLIYRKEREGKTICLARILIHTLARSLLPALVFSFHSSIKREQVSEIFMSLISCLVSITEI